MHQIHTTPGFIIDSRPYGEAGKILSIFTRDFGLVQTIAQGLRLEKSKLRYHTQLYSFGVFSLVRGKEFWRLTSAQRGEAGSWELGARSTKSIVLDSQLQTSNFKLQAPSFALTARLALLLRRLLQGEAPHPELFDCIQSSSVFIADHPGLNEKQLFQVESVIVFRMLHILGYVAKDDSLLSVLYLTRIDGELIDSITDEIRKKMNTHINKAFLESHL